MSRDEEPGILLVDLLSTNWKSSNTSFSFDPHIHEGNYDENASTEPQVAVDVSGGVSAVGGGQTGFDGLPKDDGTAPQHMRGEPTIHCLSDRNDKAAEEIGGHEPEKDIVEEMSEEVKRIIKNHETGFKQFHLLSWMGKSRTVDTGISKYLINMECNIRFWYFI